jgi:hypothetical protein
MANMHIYSLFYWQIGGNVLWVMFLVLIKLIINHSLTGGDWNFPGDKCR